MAERIQSDQVIARPLAQLDDLSQRVDGSVEIAQQALRLSHQTERQCARERLGVAEPRQSLLRQFQAARSFTFIYREVGEKDTQFTSIKRGNIIERRGPDNGGVAFGFFSLPA